MRSGALNADDKRSRVWIAVRVVLGCAVCGTIVFLWSHDVPWLLIGFGMFVLALVCLEAVTWDGRRGVQRFGDELEDDDS